jgi:RNase P protein component
MSQGFFAAPPAPGVDGRLLLQDARAGRRPARIGFTVSKKVGGRSSATGCAGNCGNRAAIGRANLHGGSDYVMVGRRAALEMSFSRLAEIRRRAVAPR